MCLEKVFLKFNWRFAYVYSVKMERNISLKLKSSPIIFLLSFSKNFALLINPLSASVALI